MAEIFSSGVATGSRKSEEWIKEKALPHVSEALFNWENAVLQKDEPIKAPLGWMCSTFSSANLCFSPSHPIHSHTNTC